jgi:hypothetical protein
MIEHYSHIRIEAKRKALEVLAPITAPEQADDTRISKPN